MLLPDRFDWPTARDELERHASGVLRQGEDITLTADTRLLLTDQATGVTYELKVENGVLAASPVRAVPTTTSNSFSYAFGVGYA